MFQRRPVHETGRFCLNAMVTRFVHIHSGRLERHLHGEQVQNRWLAWQIVRALEVDERNARTWRLWVYTKFGKFKAFYFAFTLTTRAWRRHVYGK